VDINTNIKNHSKETGAFHASEGYQTTGFEATEEGISQLAPVATLLQCWS
jgi:hypothetical protein